METTGKSLVLLLGTVILMIAASLVTYFIVSANNRTGDANVQRYNENDDQKLKFTNEGIVDISQTLRIPEKSLTLSKGLAGGRCFVLTNDQNPTFNRALIVLNEEMSLDQLEILGGVKATDFCKGLTIIPVQHFTEENFRNRREDLKAAAPNPNGGAVTNECAQRVIVQCANDTSVYKCVSGPKEVYQAKITCVNANKFTFDLSTRCKDFENTKSLRFSDCFERFLHNQQGANAPHQPQPPAFSNNSSGH